MLIYWGYKCIAGKDNIVKKKRRTHSGFILVFRNLLKVSHEYIGFEVLIVVIMKSFIFGLKRRVARWKSTEVSEKRVAAYLFRIEEYS
jgi:hypothetical protein